ncbi:hypothetical protein BGW36DRAFT_422491 [Talaromyces proteolyticus]|uniref:EKC/KEOPS complex subunit GON7 n=1 Tax=Talaromyces proteolyticus TaxID=1131652 RepID=A0AAD4L4S9_9EURO|nr:uncharacterized protein BGW36DRAFT_422491 [Talaromyces proteolyticus]KAH8705967.1 hypothetical protein BGW36DRAFT_422491 [Talaromyces proteolyticus]
MAPTSDKPIISASYSSPHPPTAQVYQHELAAPLRKGQSVAEKKAYLAELRGLVALVQGEVNIFLTERMEEDKKAAGGTKDVELEAKEEQNYGEENVEDD